MNKIRNWALATFILCFLVIIAGGVVRTTQSGMGCPDWPRCFGKWIPPTDASQLPADFEKYLRKQDIDHTFNAYHTWIEYINRLCGALLGVFAIIQVWLLFGKRKEMATAWRLAVAFLSLVILTGLFGAIVVKLNLAHLSISVHLLFAIVMLLVQLALWMTVNNKCALVTVDKSFQNFLWVFLFLLVLQSVMGTVVRMHIDDVSKALNYEQRDRWLLDSPVIFIVHRTFSWVVLLASFELIRRSRRYAGIARNAYTLFAVIILQMLTGIILYYIHMPAFAQPLHLLLACLGITQTMFILWKTNKHTTVAV
ncbi:MAG: COX15/CtaA family protein [Ferruginibacter sp.]